MARVAIVPLLAAIFKKKAKSDFLMPVSHFVADSTNNPFKS